MTAATQLLDRLGAAVDPVDAPTAPAPTGMRSAAVMVIADPSDAALPLIFLRRSEHLRHHPGQIAFPGGVTEPEDAGPVQTALRETFEEVGVPAAALDVLGLLPPLLTAVSLRWLTPVVAVQRHAVELHADDFEVQEVFRVGLEELLHAPHTVREMGSDGQTRSVHFYEAGGRVIWGVTGAILHELMRRLGRED